MKQLILIIVSLLITSCSSQTDLETLKLTQTFHQHWRIQNSKKDKNIDFSLVAYITEDI